MAFTEEWVSGHVEDHLALSPVQLRLGYSCTYLNSRTLRGFGRVVDAGCGIGYLHRYLEQQRWRGRYTGVDSSPASLSTARTMFPNTQFVQGELTALPFGSNAIDLVYARDSVIHCGAPREAVADLYRVGRYLLLRLRIADVPGVFTAHYRDADRLHVWFGIEWLLGVLDEQRPRPRMIRYRLNATRRPFERSRFVEAAPFTSYAAADVLIAKGTPDTMRTEVIEDAPWRWVSIADRLLGWRNYSAVL